MSIRRTVGEITTSISGCSYRRPGGRATNAVVSSLDEPEAEANAWTPHGRIGTATVISSFASPRLAASVSRTSSPSGTSNGSNRTCSTPSALTSIRLGSTLSRPPA